MKLNNRGVIGVFFFPVAIAGALCFGIIISYMPFTKNKLTYEAFKNKPHTIDTPDTYMGNGGYMVHE